MVICLESLTAPELLFYVGKYVDIDGTNVDFYLGFVNGM